MDKKLAKKTKEGIKWSGASGGILFAVRLGTSMIVARLLFPEDFGLMGMAIVVTQFAKRLTSFGFNLAVVQRKDLKEEHLDTVFTFNMLLVASVTMMTYFGAGLISSFFNSPELAPILRVVSALFIIRGIASINQSLLMRKMKFKELAFASIFGESVTFISPVFFALADFGVWSLVWGRMLGASTSTVILFYHTRWCPRFAFKYWAFKDLFSFGFSVFIIRYVSYFISKIDYVFVGKFIGATQLGFYERSYTLMDTPRSQLQGATASVFFSAYSQLQDDNEKIVAALKKVIAYVSILAFGVFIWMFFAAPSLITILYGEKWIESIVPVKIMCFSGLIYTMVTLFLPVITAKALVGKHAIYQIIYFGIISAAIWYGLRWGIVGVSWAVTISSGISLLMVLHLISSHLPFSLKDFIFAQKSGFIYGLVHIGFQTASFYGLQGFVSERSIISLFFVSIIPIVSFYACHNVLRFKDAQECLEELSKEFQKITKKFRPGKSK